MFGYIRTHRPELKVWEDEFYKGIYCSLCRELGKRYGILSRMFLSYDTTFLAIAILALSEKGNLSFKKKRCPFNPAKKCNFCTDQRTEISFAADISVILVYHKIKDDIRDSTLFKAFFCRILAILLLPSFKKAVKFNPEAAIIIDDYVKEQNAVEEKQSAVIDEAAEPTAVMLRRIFALNEPNEDTKRIREYIGYNIGRWIYLIDAFDDLEKDKKSGNYNPFIKSGNCDCDKIKGDLLMTAGEAAKASELLDIKNYKGIIDNIIYDGLYYETIKVYERRRKNEQSI